MKKSRRRPTLPHGFPCSTIGSEELNFRVRDGIGCGLLEITTGNFWIVQGSRRLASGAACLGNMTTGRDSRDPNPARDARASALARERRSKFALEIWSSRTAY